MKIHPYLIAVPFLTTIGSLAQEADPNAGAVNALAAHATAFVEAYNKADPGALSNHFLPDGEIVLANGEIVAGREAIEEFYADVFSAPAKPKAAIEAGSVRFVTPGVAIEDGTFHVTIPGGGVKSHFYTAILVKQENGNWLTASIRDELEDHALPGEKLIALDWLIGDWLIERDGSRTFLSFSWSDDGPYIDGKAVTEQAGASATSSTYRIGWNSKRRDFVSWAFDALGGFNKSDWTTTETGWLLRTQGVTADGESNRSTQSIEADPSSQSFLLNTRDQTLDGRSVPETTIRVVKRPPEPSSAQPEN